MAIFLKNHICVIIVILQMNLASQSVLEGLNACLDHRGEVGVNYLVWSVMHVIIDVACM